MAYQRTRLKENGLNLVDDAIREARSAIAKYAEQEHANPCLHGATIAFVLGSQIRDSFDEGKMRNQDGTEVDRDLFISDLADDLRAGLLKGFYLDPDKR